VLEHPEKAAISVYAQGRDYHDIVKKRLKRLARWLITEGGGELKVFVDTAPVPEKALGQAAGLGWQGKHTNLLSRDWGNWAFLGAIFTTLDLAPDAPEVDHCGSCTACQDICPTDAFPEPYRLDARRCISYLTIEHRGPVDLELREKMGNRIYGCDDCLAICPWNKFAVSASDLRYHGREVAASDLAELAVLDNAAFRARFSGSPIKRIGRDRFVRNVLYAIGNSGLASLRPVAQGLTGEADPTVAEAARWAAARLPRS
jgi:epoxyqueuosine reductase